MTRSGGESRFVSRGGVRLHYVVAGHGPTLILIHGIPDFWNGWRYQIAHFRNDYRVVAVDLRGVNLSDKPTGVSAYRISELVRDTVAVIDDLGLERASIIGHDWGAIIGWWTAILAPARVERLAALSAPHPVCYVIAKEQGDIYNSPDYLAQMIEAAPGDAFDARWMSLWVADPIARAELEAALLRSDVESLRNFYRANQLDQSVRLARIPPVAAPVLAMYGTEDRLVSREAYEQSAIHVTGKFLSIAIPEAGHFLHQEAAGRVNGELQTWLETH
ncbi:MAG: alpha/beta hydrolase [Aromatoleum sp.]|nr:alpha/beta hydrolase [Aromatoleum sp.]